MTPTIDKDCPFCGPKGGAATLVDTEFPPFANLMMWVECGMCSCRGPLAMYIPQNRNEAVGIVIKGWNTRP